MCQLQQGRVTSRSIQESGAWPEARWRHSATQVHLGGPGLVLLGGLGLSGVLSLEDAWVLDTDNVSWQHFQVDPAPDGGYPCGRHSHAACLGSGGVLICGGLDEQEQLLSDAWTLHAVFDGVQNRFKLAWRQALSPLPQPRYGHNLHVHLDHVIVVGGIEASYGAAPICAFGRPVHVQCETIKDGEEEIFMWHNLASLYLDGFVLVLGGGGNCFSFGTHLNQSARRIDLNALIKLAEKSQGRLSVQCCPWQLC